MTAAAPSPLKRREIIEALRRGTVPRRGLEVFAVGLERFERAIDEELAAAKAGRAQFKAVRGEYGSGKTFFARWLAHRAHAAGFATALVQISETDTPLYRMETLYRRALDSLETGEWAQAAFRRLIDTWFYELEEEALAREDVSEDRPEQLAAIVGELLEQRLTAVGEVHPQFSAALRACHTARMNDDDATAEGLLAWLMGQPNVGAGIKRAADVKGDLDHRGAAGFFRGLLAVLRQLGRAGLVLILDEVETIQRVRADSRAKSLNALRQLIDDLDAGVFPNMYVLMTGTPQFYDGPQGIRRLAPLHQRLHFDFGSAPPEFDNSRAVQIRLPAFDRARLLEVGRKIRDLYPSEDPARIQARVDDEVLARLADGVAGQLGGKVGVAPRIFLRKLVGEVLDRVEEHEGFDPVRHYEPIVAAAELRDEEAAAAGIRRSVDDIELEL